jgi:uncharacterized protein (TIGR00369 family)
VCGEDNPRGFRLRSRVAGENVELRYTTRDEDVGWRHIVHGGIAMTLLDEVMTWAAIIASSRACVAAEMTTRLRRPVEVGWNLRVTGRVTAARARIILTEAEMRNQDGETLVTATGKYMPMAAEQFSLCADDFVTSPEAIDPQALISGGA